jgi:hypothetical protein
MSVRRLLLAAARRQHGQREHHAAGRAEEPPPSDSEPSGVIVTHSEGAPQRLTHERQAGQRVVFAVRQRVHAER